MHDQMNNKEADVDSPISTLAKFKDDADLAAKIDSVEKEKHSWRSTLWLTYASLGIVYGDIGTSPLYTIAGIYSTYQNPPTEVQILGAMSLIFWSLTCIVLVKYVLIVLRANDKGEGGTFALYTRLCRSLGIKPTWGGSIPKEDLQCCEESCKSESLHNEAVSKRSISQWGFKWAHWGAFPSESWRTPFRKYAFARYTLMSVSVIATAMVIGDGVLTPAISVVSAVSGLTIRTSISQSGIVGVSIAILFVLFFIQSFGTEKVSFLFSPIIVLWMASIGGVGVYNLWLNQGTTVIKGLSPHYIILYFQDQGTEGWLSLGGVMLALTGAEALFADLGHFSIQSITISFSFVIYPCLVLNYLGQMAHLLNYPEDYASIFWLSIPDPYFWPMLVIATAAAIVASQALITGVFSLVRQAMQLGAFPQWKVLHTGRKVEGQVYIGSINFILMALCIAVVAGFNGNGTSIGNAYGIAVSTVFLITDQLVSLVMIIDWKLSSWIVVVYWTFFSVVDGAYLSANLVKVPQGGWFAIAITAGVALVNFIWLTGMQAKERAIKAARPKVKLDDVIAPSLALDDDELGKFFAFQSAAPHTLTSASFPRRQSASEKSGHAGSSRIHSSSMPFSAATKRVPSMTPFSVPTIQEVTVNSHPEAFSNNPPNLGGVLRLRSIHSGEGVKSMPSGSNAVLAPPGGGGGGGGRHHQVLATRSRRLGTGLSAISTSSIHQHVLTYAPSIFSGGVAVHVDPGHTATTTATYAAPESRDEVRVDLGSIQDGNYTGGGGPVAEGLEHQEEAGNDNNSLLSARNPSLASHVPTEFVEQCVGVATLRGIGIYYTDQGSGIPPVMWHFLKNIEGLHQFVILLQVRVMPIPFLEQGERLVAVPVDNLPCFYRVAARYGYMEEINHGPEFIDELILYVADQLEKAASSADQGMPRASSGQHQNALERITEAGGGEDPSIRSQPTRISVADLSVFSIQAVARKAGIDPSASRGALDTLRSAYETSGVVYYTIGFNLRMKKLPYFILQLGHDFWYDSLFKQLFINQYNESDFWSIPNDSLVELSIAIDI